MSDSRVRAFVRATGHGSFAGSLSDVGSFEDPTTASTCTTADASPGVPTDASIGAMCGDEPSTVSEDYSVNDADGSGVTSAPAGSACLFAGTSAGVPATGQVSAVCTGPDGSTPSTVAAYSDANANGTSGDTAPAGSSCLEASAVAGTSPGTNLSSPCGSSSVGGAGAPSGASASTNGDSARSAVGATNGAAARATNGPTQDALLGLGALPFTATDSAGVGLLGAALTFIGVLLLRRRTQS